MEKIEELVAELKRKEAIFVAAQSVYKDAEARRQVASAELSAAETARDEVKGRLKKALGF